MSRQNYQDQSAELILERKENRPILNKICKGYVIVKNANGLYVDINKTFEAVINLKDLGIKKIEDYKIGELIEFITFGEDKNTEGVYRASIKLFENTQQWSELENLKNQNLDLAIHKVLKSGVEVIIQATNQIGFIPFGYLEQRQNPLKELDREQWIGQRIQGRIHELDQEKNKIILNNKIICQEQKQLKALELINQINIGQEIEGEVVRITDFGVFVDIGGIDALVPSSELSWKRFKNPADIVELGQKIKAKIFKIEKEQNRVAMSVKQTELCPWANLPESIKPGHRLKARIVTKAEFGVFAEILPGVEALFHKSNFPDGINPQIGEEYLFEITNIDISKKRMGLRLAPHGSTDSSGSNKELEHV